MNDTPTLNYWPLLMMPEDIFVPELAPVVRETIREIDINTVTAMLAVAWIQASYDASKRLN